MLFRPLRSGAMKWQLAKRHGGWSRTPYSGDVFAVNCSFFLTTTSFHPILISKTCWDFKLDTPLPVLEFPLTMTPSAGFWRCAGVALRSERGSHFSADIRFRSSSILAYRSSLVEKYDSEAVITKTSLSSSHRRKDWKELMKDRGWGHKYKWRIGEQEHKLPSKSEVPRLLG